MLNSRRIARIFLQAFRNVAREEASARLAAAKNPVLATADRYLPRTKRVIEAAFGEAKNKIPRTALVLALENSDSERVQALVEAALIRMKGAMKAPLSKVMTQILDASGKQTGQKLNKFLRVASWNPDQPRDEDGKWAPAGGAGDSGPAKAQQDTFNKRFEQSQKDFPKLSLKERDVRNTTLPRDSVYSGDTVDGLRVRTDVPNTDSISASFNEDEYEELPGIREVSLDDLDLGDYSAKDDNDRVENLAESIKESEEISPLIIVRDSQGTYVLEGNHRARALKKLGKKKVPAVVLVHYDEPLRDNTRILLRPIDYATTLSGGDHFRVAAPKIKGFAFDRTNPRAKEWVDEHVGELIDEMSRSTRERVKDLVGQAVDGEFDTHDLADRITELIGDESRAETIARTETMAASNGGQREAWAQAVDEGLLNGDEQEEWITTPDGDTCDICQPMDGVKKPLGGQFNVGGELIDGPPAHPRCRCTTALAL